MPLPVSERLSADGKKRAEVIKQIHEKARQNLEAKTKQYAKHSNKGRRQMEFKAGDLVWLHLRKERFPQERKSKLMPRIDGPFKIIHKINDNSYKLDLQGKYQVSNSFNVADIVPYVADEFDLRTNPFQEGEDDENDKGSTQRTKEMELELGDVELEPADAMEIQQGPMTRARTKKLAEAISLFLSHSWNSSNDLSLDVIHTTIICIQANDQQLG